MRTFTDPLASAIVSGPNRVVVINRA